MTNADLLAQFRQRLAEALPHATPYEQTTLGMRLIYASRGYANGRSSALKDAQVFAGVYGLRVSACGRSLRVFREQHGEFPIPE